MINKIKTAGADLFSDGRGLVFLMVTLGFVLLNGFRFMFPALLPFFRVEFQMDLTTAGALLTALWLAYAIGQIPGGLLSDFFGERNLLVLSCGLAFGTVILITVSTTMWGFIIAAVGFGVAFGLYSPVRLTVLKDLYPDNGGTAIGISLGASSLGTTALPVIAAFIAGIVGWRVGFGFMIPFIGVIAIGLWFTVPNRTSPKIRRDGTTSSLFVRPLKQVLRPSPLSLIVSMFCMHFLFQAFTSFFPTYLVEIKGMTEQTAALLYGLFFAVGMVIQPVSGVFGDRIGEMRILLFTAISTILALLLLPFGFSLVHLVLLTLCLSIQRGFWPVANSYLVEQFPSDVQASAVGISRTGYVTLGAVGPVLVGIIADAGYFDEAFMLLAGVTAVAAVVLVYHMRQYQRRQPHRS